MIPGYIIFLIFFVILYISTDENRQFTATTTALREIWSGGCRLACVRSECSGLSGLSGLDAAGTSRHCACQFCPCPLIDSVIRSCEPAGSAYCTAVETLSEFYYSLFKTFAELCLLVQSALERGAPGRPGGPPAQNLNLNTLDTENFNFGGAPSPEGAVQDKNEKVIDKVKKKLSAFSKQDSKISLKKIKSVTSMKNLRESISGVIKQAVKDVKLDKKKSAELRPSPVSLDADAQASASTSSGHCPRCVEKGKICIGSCPKANVNNNQ